MSDLAPLPELPPPEPEPALPPAPPELELELALPPEEVPRFWRQAAVARHLAGRPRSMAESYVWLDTAEGHLAKLGQALEAPRKGRRRHLQVLPPPGFAVPGAAPRLLDEYDAGDAPQAVQDKVLLPTAAFEGRRAEAEVGAVRMLLRHGNLRCVAAEAPAARLLLSGPAAEVLPLVQGLARDLPLLPAAIGLAETARALSRQERPRPRHQGPPDLHEADTVEDALCLAIAHLTDVLVVQAARVRREDGPEGVHQSRVATRRLRSCLKQFRPALDGTELRGLDAMLRGFAAAMGEARDLDVFLLNMGADLAAAAGPGERRLDSLLRIARTRRDAAYATLRDMLDGPEFRRLVWTATRLAVLREWGAEAPSEAPVPLRPFAHATLTRRWKRLRKQGAGIEALDAEALHELRLEAKRMRYSAELFAPLWPGRPARRFIKRLSAVQEALGVANDTHVARALVAGLGGRSGASAWAVGLAEGFALARGAGARDLALDAWAQLQRVDVFWDN
jgi:CHAD domain-containing protein